MKILYIPLDERPCNYDFPLYIADGNKEITLYRPEKDLLGEKKTSANLTNLWNYVFEMINTVDAAILSMDMLLFGGLIPSRLHHLDNKTVDHYVENIKKLKEMNPNVKLYASQCIMRCPNYNSSEEEPDYYEDYGYALHQIKALSDKEQRLGLNETEREELNSLMVPDDIVRDYETRRDFNLSYNLKVVDLVNEGVLDFLVIPQDDSAPFGYTAIAQKRVVEYLSQNHLESRINIYPGADEVGNSLIARCLNDATDKQTKVYAFYSSTEGPLITPLYEDRPFAESLKYHLDVTNSYLVNNPEDADYILAINTPGKIMQESFYQSDKDITYTSHRNLLYFVKMIDRYIKQGYKVSVCDSAYSNGGDIQLIQYLDERNLLDKLLGYAGWNTNCNSLGTVLSMSIYNLESNPLEYRDHLVYRYCEDVIYQAIVRQDILLNVLPQHDLSYYDFKDKEDLVCNEIRQRILNIYNTYQVSKVYPITNLSVFMPWHRMFEVGFKLSVQ